MTEGMTKEATPKKVAFMTKPYSNEQRIEKEEKELKELTEEQKGEVKEEEPSSPEEKTFKKRYSDLRRHQQKQSEEFKSKIEALESQLSEATRKEMRLPTSEEDLDAWVKKYPDVAAIVETIAIKKAKEQSADIQKKLQAIDEMKISATKEKAEAELLHIHPDFADIRESDDFHEWAEEQPKWVQDALYENDSDARSAARAIDLYKVDRNIKKESGQQSNDIAKTVSTKSMRSKPQEKNKGGIRESDVQKMSAQQYEKNSEAIMESMRNGTFIYDVSGSAR
tara:strand:- start:1931 stop:2773 length:843 start_codon:yes stop_codon:yes gene_type:complete